MNDDEIRFKLLDDGDETAIENLIGSLERLCRTLHTLEPDERRGLLRRLLQALQASEKITIQS